MNKLDGYIRAQRPPFVTTAILGTIGVGFIVYGAWWILHRHTPIRREDFGPLGIGALFAALAVYVFVGNVRSIAAMHRFLARPADEVVWVYVRSFRDYRSLELAAFDGSRTNVKLNWSAFSVPSDAELEAVLREAAQRYPRATVGFDPSVAARFTADPRTLRGA